MTKAGDYDTRFLWKRTSKSKEPNLGEMLEDRSNVKRLWGALDTMTGKRMAAMGLAGNLSQVVIRIRNYPSVGFNDVLIDEANEVTYVIDTVAAGDDELVISAHALED